MSKQVNTEAKSQDKKVNLKDKLMASLGIKANQIDKTKATTTKVKAINTNADKLKLEAKQSIAKVNEENGENISFQCFQRDGKTQDGEPKYKIKNMSGFWTIDKTKDGLFIASRVLYYTESYTIADYK